MYITQRWRCCAVFFTISAPRKQIPQFYQILYSVISSHKYWFNFDFDRSTGDACILCFWWKIPNIVYNQLMQFYERVFSIVIHRNSMLNSKKVITLRIHNCCHANILFKLMYYNDVEKKLWWPQHNGF